jgi:hypothetical protein
MTALSQHNRSQNSHNSYDCAESTQQVRKNFTFWYNHILTRLFHNFLAEIFAKSFVPTKIDAKIVAKTKIFAKTFAKRKFVRNKISQKLPHFRMIFAFCENDKNVFVSTLGFFVMQSKI